jgi:hypothetical protein
VAFGAGGTRGPPSELIHSKTHHQPSFQILNKQVVQWYRAVAPDFEWKIHEMENRGSGLFVDVQSVPIPVPPAPKGNGLYENKWNEVAGDKLLPWLLPSVYRARYVSGAYAGEWSKESEVFRSDQYTSPSLVVDRFGDVANLPLEHFQIEWEACGSYIQLPMRDYQSSFMMTHNDRTFWGISHPFGRYRAGSGDLVMSVVNFVNAWNSFNTDYRWPMSMLPDGTLQLTIVNKSEMPGADFWLYTGSHAYNEWWPLMGFDGAGPWQNGEPITAEGPVATEGCMYKLGGVQFVDQGNPFM